MTHKPSQAGQSLIETIIAIFILVSALSAGLGMAIFALNASASDKNTIIATNLAREGLDVARLMRDTNWLAGGQPSSCADLGGQPCFPDAFTGPAYNFNLPAPGATPSITSTRIDFDPVNHRWENLNDLDNQEDYWLCLQSDGTYQGNRNSGTPACSAATSNFVRRLRITTRSGTSLNYSTTDRDNMEVIVQSIVQWKGKRCPTINTSNLTEASGPCKIVVEERLTNWKDYR